jgi:tetratricopeptide (TPR) repeat protein
MPRKRSAKSKKLGRGELRDLDVSISFLEGVSRRDPEFIEAWQILGDHYARRGRHSQSLKVDQRLSELEPRNPVVFYNLACSYSLNRALDNAVVALDKAISLGYRDFRWLAKDPDHRRLRKHPLFRTIEDKIRKMTITVA